MLSSMPNSISTATPTSSCTPCFRPPGKVWNFLQGIQSAASCFCSQLEPGVVTSCAVVVDPPHSEKGSNIVTAVCSFSACKQCGILHLADDVHMTASQLGSNVAAIQPHPVSTQSDPNCCAAWLGQYLDRKSVDLMTASLRREARAAAAVYCLGYCQRYKHRIHNHIMSARQSGSNCGCKSGGLISTPV